MLDNLSAHLLTMLRTLTIEPIMLIDGACKEVMILFAENIQMNRICSVKLGYPDEVCNNLTAHHENNVLVQQEFSVFTFYNSIIMSVVPLIYFLFMGAWSDKYGRKIPMLLTLIAHMIHASGYLLVNWQTKWPVEVLYLITLVESLGGASGGLLSSTNSYISDITSLHQRTSRLNILNSLWYLGFPVGTMVGAIVIKHHGYDLALALLVLSYISTIVYVKVFIPESHGPYAKQHLMGIGESSGSHTKDIQKSATLEKKDQQLTAKGSLPSKESCGIQKKDVKLGNMLRDFFNWRRVMESFKTVFKRREGNTRAILLTILFSHMIRRMARCFFMYVFTRRMLLWDATEYGYWVSYRNLLVALGSLVMVPLLTKKTSVTDLALVVIGSLSIVGESISYGLVLHPGQAFLIWLGPVIGILSNTLFIALRSMCTKLVAREENGRINGVTAALISVSPVLGYATFTPIYYHTVSFFPSAQFFFGAALNLLIMITFTAIGCSQDTSNNGKDLEATKSKPVNGKTNNSSTAVTKQTLATFSGSKCSNDNSSSLQSEDHQTPASNQYIQRSMIDNGANEDQEVPALSESEMRRRIRNYNENRKNIDSDMGSQVKVQSNRNKNIAEQDDSEMTQMRTQNQDHNETRMPNRQLHVPSVSDGLQPLSK